ncbi:MAG TPA: hypothetical protein VMW52_02225 [Phycisphaerae bacterium]|nr:hypothetical protein [Phycisphaerae bacterium]
MNQSPSQSGQPNATAAPPREELKSIAIKQRRVLICILCYIVIFVLALVLIDLSGAPARLVKLCLLATGIVSAVFVFMLGIQLYGTAVGVLLGLLTFLPFIGLLVLLIVNAKATRTLKAGGLRVGFLGVHPSQFKIE